MCCGRDKTMEDILAISIYSNFVLHIKLYYIHILFNKIYFSSHLVCYTFMLICKSVSKDTAIICKSVSKDTAIIFRKRDKISIMRIDPQEFLYKATNMITGYRYNIYLEVLQASLLVL